MKNIYKIVAGMVLILFASCEKEIELDLADTDSKIVIEGVISNFSNIQTIKIHKSVLFYESSNYPAVSNAIVTVSDNGAAPVPFLEVSPGTYQANFSGVPNHTYNLSVKIEGIEYISTSKMPETVPLNQLTYEESSFPSTGNTTLYTVTPVFIDPIDKTNFYRFGVTIDGTQDKSINTLDDVLINGIENTFPIFRTENDIVSGSIVKITMYGIDQNVYNYFFVLQQNGDGQATPNNPISNINSGVLGYFSAQNKQEMTIKIL
jgi:Domain of unknown function (DUF4249)